LAELSGLTDVDAITLAAHERVTGLIFSHGRCYFEARQPAVRLDPGPEGLNLAGENRMKPSRRLRVATTAETPTDEPLIVQHPDGYYWFTQVHEVGPFATFDDARADMDATETSDVAGVEPGETLAQAEDDIGVENWIDPDTGSLAEEQRPRIEEH